MFIPTLLIAGVLMVGPAIQRTGLAQPSQPPVWDDPERAFLMQMVAHHHMAVMMAQPLVEGAVHEELRALAREIVATQSAEIAQMLGWLSEWYGMAMPMGPGMMPGPEAMGPALPMGSGMMPGPQGMGMPGMEMPHGATPGVPMGPGMLPAQPGEPGVHPMMEMMSLAGLSGERLEVAFLLLMIPHHQGAITMAEQVLERAQREEVRRLAQEIIAAQSAEIDQMNAWLAAWYGL